MLNKSGCSRDLGARTAPLKEELAYIQGTRVELCSFLIVLASNCAENPLKKIVGIGDSCVQNPVKSEVV